MPTFEFTESTRQFLIELFNDHSQLDEINRKLTKLLKSNKETLTTMSQFSDALAAFQSEQAALLANIQTEIQQLADAVAAGNTNAADLEAGLTALQAATTAAQEANAALTADDSPVVTASES
jgi:septal ring factor EnvC (AmiA/AmiB activator)